MFPVTDLESGLVRLVVLALAWCLLQTCARRLTHDERERKRSAELAHVISELAAVKAELAAHGARSAGAFNELTELTMSRAKACAAGLRSLERALAKQAGQIAEVRDAIDGGGGASRALFFSRAGGTKLHTTLDSISAEHAVEIRVDAASYEALLASKLMARSVAAGDEQ